ncbi:hypothetical protein RND81_01G190800 [Saponaria officinalis]|uniref:Mitochondrial carrier protein MTM1 n=1 Tax=Saponaria officinalis TaxID=3572 RepID=A0AAW1NB13_SAPOF
MSGARNAPPPTTWIAAAANRVDYGGTGDKSMSNEEDRGNPSSPSLSDFKLSLGERALSAAGAAVISAIIVNPLDVAKTRLQAQAAGVPYQSECVPTCTESNAMLPELKSARSHNGVVFGEGAACSECSTYRGTFDVFTKVTRQEGFSRLWRGTNASLALAIPTVGIYLPCYDILRNYLEDCTEHHAPMLTPYSPLVAGSAARILACITCYPIELARTRMQAFKDIQVGAKPPGVWKTLLGAVTPLRSANHFQNLQNYRVWWTGLGAQLARDVPFSAICWGTLEPIRRKILSLTGDEVTAANILGANFAAGFVAGSLAASATCPLDVARTRRQIEKDPARQMKMNTRQTLMEIWRDGGWRGLFTGVTPRVARAGPSVGIVISSYEVVKYALYHRHMTVD